MSNNKKNNVNVFNLIKWPFKAINAALTALARGGNFVFGIVFFVSVSLGSYLSVKYYTLFNKVDGSIFEIIGHRSTGTGFQVVNPITGKVFFLTNDHVCDGSDGKNIHVQVGQKLVKLKILKRNYAYDMCIASPLPNIAPLKVSTNREGRVFMIDGFGYGIKDISFGKFVKKIKETFAIAPVSDVPFFMPEFNIMTMSRKECSGVGFSIKKIPTQIGELDVCFATRTSMMGTMKAFPGNSGSPIVNMDGEAVALVWGTYPPTFSSISVPIEIFVELSSKLK